MRTQLGIQSNRVGYEIPLPLDTGYNEVGGEDKQKIKWTKVNKCKAGCSCCMHNVLSVYIMQGTNSTQLQTEQTRHGQTALTSYTWNVTVQVGIKYIELFLLIGEQLLLNDLFSLSLGSFSCQIATKQVPYTSIMANGDVTFLRPPLLPHAWRPPFITFTTESTY